MNHQYFSFWRNNHKLTSLVMGVLFVIPTFPAYAEFKPSDRKPASGYSRAGGSRGCASSGIPITQLAPDTFVGKTASTRPMLAWYMPSSQTVRFGLFELESATKVKRIGKSKEIPTVIGINKLKLPLDYPELAVGKTYLWQISVDCGKDMIVNGVEFTVINSQSLPNKQFTTVQERVNYYSENELWYEALEEALNAARNGKLSQIASTLVQNLAQSENKQKNEQRIEHLRKISGNT